jgi:HAD superfamily hydrolase (TIGR01509 family)
MIGALLFDFDGVILDTETPLFEGWRTIFREHGCELGVEVWIDRLGRPAGMPLEELLEQNLGRAVDRDTIMRTYRQRTRAIIDALPVMPGVTALLEAAKARGVRCAVVSGSSGDWVSGYVERLGLMPLFDCLITREDTAEHKPSPQPFLKAAELLGVAPAETVVIEDSPNGVAAGRAAGMFVVAVPTAMTAALAMPGADLAVDSLASLTLDDLEQAMAHARR